MPALDHGPWQCIRLSWPEYIYIYICYICTLSAGDRIARAAHVAGFVGQVELAAGGSWRAAGGGFIGQSVRLMMLHYEFIGAGVC